jgi:signal transduction histidine kinase
LYDLRIAAFMDTSGQKFNDLRKEVNYYKAQLNQLTGDFVSRDYQVIDMSIEIAQMRKGLELIAALNQFKSIAVFEEIYEHITEQMNVHMQMDLSMILQPLAEMPGYFSPAFIKGNFSAEAAISVQQKICIPASFIEQKCSLLVNRDTASSPFINMLVDCFGMPFFILTPVIVQKQVISYLFTGRKKETVLLAASRLLMHDVHTLEAIAGVIAALKNQHEQFQLIVNERERISSDMHDEIGSGITHIALMSELIQTQQKDEKGLKKDISIIALSAHRLVQTMSEIIWALNPHNDTLENLLAYIREQSQQFFEPLKIQFDIYFPDAVPDTKLSNVQRRNLYLVTREALNNALKHSEATAIQLKFELLGSGCSFSVNDNGTGIVTTGIKAGNNGLKNMKKRMEDLGGTIAWISKENGTSVEYCIPIY